jgi:hypothetical protein
MEINDDFVKVVDIFTKICKDGTSLLRMLWRYVSVCEWRCGNVFPVASAPFMAQ